MVIFKILALLISTRALKVPGKINHARISVLAAAEPRGGLDDALEKWCCGKYYSVVEEVIVY